MILVFVQSGTWYIELKRTAIFIKNELAAEIVMVFLVEYPFVDRDIDACKRLGFKCFKVGQLLAEFSEGDCSRNGKNSGFLNFFRRFYESDYINLSNIKDQYNFIYQKLLPKLVILGGDNPGYDTALAIAAAAKVGITSVLVPSTMSNGMEEAEVYRKSSAHTRFSMANVICMIFFPKWVLFYKFRPVLRVPGSRALAYEALGVSPSQPWAFCSGRANYLLVESAALDKYYNFKKGKKNPKKVLAGSLINNEIFENLQHKQDLVRKTNADYGFKRCKKILVSALPPDFYYLEGGRPEAEFENYEECVNKWIDAMNLASKEFNVLVCVHPSVRCEDYVNYESEFVKIFKGETSEAISVASIYCASVSSTIRNAIAAGVPVINYDTYRYGYTDFNNVAGVINVYKYKDFIKEIKSLVGGSVKAQPESEVLLWGGGDIARLARANLYKFFNLVIKNA